jgi:hypothetical protein
LPTVRAVTVIGAAVAPACVPVFVTPPFDDAHVAVWEVIAEPLFAPMVNDTLICPAATFTADTPVGGAGEPTITGNDATDAKPAPRAFVALTVHVYDLPVVTAATVIGAAVAPTCVPVFVTPPFDDTHVAVCEVIAALLFAPSTNVTTNEPVAVVVEPDLATTAVGAAGVPTITGNEATETALVPTALAAFTVHVYVLAVVTAATVIGAAVAPACVPVLSTPPFDDVQVAV